MRWNSKLIANSFPFSDILDRTESLERSDAESADSLDVLDSYTLTTFLGQNIVSKPQSRHRKRGLRHSTVGNSNEPRTTNRGNIITARCRPQSTSALPPSSLTSGSKADSVHAVMKDAEVWQRADIPPIEEKYVSNHDNYSTPPPPPPPVVQLPASVPGSVTSVTERHVPLNGTHNDVSRPLIQHESYLTHSSPNRSTYNDPPQRDGGGHHPANQQSPSSLVHSTSLLGQRPTPHIMLHHAQPPQAPQRSSLYKKKCEQVFPEQSMTYQYHHNVINNFQPKKPPRTFEATEGKY